MVGADDAAAEVGYVGKAAVLALPGGAPHC